MSGVTSLLINPRKQDSPVSHNKGGVASDLHLSYIIGGISSLPVPHEEEHTHTHNKMQDYSNVLLLSKNLTPADKDLFLFHVSYFTHESGIAECAVISIASRRECVRLQE